MLILLFAEALRSFFDTAKESAEAKPYQGNSEKLRNYFHNAFDPA